jgi:serine/threonine protein phosphatase PrpC/LysM repeat protein
MARQPEFEACSYTDIGKVRQINEDYFGQFSTINGDLFVVCDGMGGHLGGATAARMAVESIRVFFEHQRYENPIEALRQSLLYANTKILTASQQSPELEGMGTTGVAMLIRDGLVYHAHVGDSRLYRLTNGILHRLTKDQTYVQQLVDKGEITAQAALDHPRRHELTQALGVDAEVEIEIGNTLIYPDAGDVFMLCTDGLSGVLTDDGIRQILSQDGSAKEMAERLVQTANHASGADNITAQVIVFETSEQAFVPLPSALPEPAVRDFPSETAEPIEVMTQNTFETEKTETSAYELNKDLSETAPAYSEEYEHPNPIETTSSIADNSVKKTSSKPDLALILLCGLAAVTIGLFIAGWKYINSDPVENSELTTVQANTSTDSETEAPEEAVTDEAAEETKPATSTGTAATEKTPAPAKTETPKPKEPEKPKTTEATESKPAVAAGGTTISHTVKAGETFRGIANRYNLKYETLKALNPQVKDVEKDLKSDVTKLTVRVKAVHMVGPGDILNVVSKKYDVSKDLIMTANKKTADRAERGEKLIIPVAEKQ